MARNQNERDLNGWKNAPIPICMGGDIRGLTWCCKPGYSLTFGFKCLRDEVLKKVGLTPKKFMEIKEKFSKEHGFDDSTAVCFGSLSYCCMRNGGCSRRDFALATKNPGVDFEEVKKQYFEKKKELGKILLEACENKEYVEEYLQDFE